MVRKSFTLSIEEDLIKKIKKIAVDKNKDVSDIIENYIKKEQLENNTSSLGVGSEKDKKEGD